MGVSKPAKHYAPESLEAHPPDVLVDSPADWTAALSPITLRAPSISRIL